MSAAVQNTPKELVILAAGMGSRIRAGGRDTPKPLVSVGGLPLLKRAILTAQRAGVERFVVILGYERHLIHDVLAGDEQLRDLNIEWVMHEGYELKNGVSVLQAAPHISGEFYLTMADHVVEPALYRALGEAPLKGDLALAVFFYGGIAAGAVLAVMGFFEIFFLPRFIARAWKAGDDKRQ